MSYTYSLKNADNKSAFVQGTKDGIPIALAYFAVSFSLGIAAKNAGLSAFQGAVTSALCTASAGEYVGFTMIAASATLLETALATLVTNARYFLMSCALSQKMNEDMPFFHRFIVAHFVTDELFGIAINRKGEFNPFYSYGAILSAVPWWSVGTALGVFAGNIMPLRLASAFSVALYGMFLAIIIPPARKEKAVMIVVIASFVLSSVAYYVPAFASVADGTKTIIITIVVSAAAAVLFPHNEKEEDM